MTLFVHLKHFKPNHNVTLVKKPVVDLPHRESIKSNGAVSLTNESKGGTANVGSSRSLLPSHPVIIP